MLKALERLAKTLLAWLAGLWLSRAPRTLGTGRKLLLVRPDDRVGEALLMTPLLEALAGRFESVDVLVHARCVRVLEGHPKVRRVIGLNRRWLALGAWAPGLEPLRAERYDVVLNCANWAVPSVTAALVSRLAGPEAVVIGPAVGITARLMDVQVPPLTDTTAEVAQRLHLLSVLGIETRSAPLSFREPRPSDAIKPLLEKKYAVVNPGGRLDWRRVPAEVFAAACRVLVKAGRTPLVTWGPGEEPLAREVARLAEGSVVAPATSLDDLAALMKAGGLSVCNNTGPMHLSVAVGCRTVALFLNMPIERWGHVTSPHRVVDLTPFAHSRDTMAAEVAPALIDILGNEQIAPSALPSPVLPPTLAESAVPPSLSAAPALSPAPGTVFPPVAAAVSPVAVLPVVGAVAGSAFVPGAPAVAAPPAPPAITVHAQHHFELPKRLLTQLRKTESERGRDAVASKHDAFLMDSELGAPTYLAADGCVIVDDAGTIREATDDEAVAAIVKGARHWSLPVLMNLLPSRAAGATTCSSCEGVRWVTLSNGQDGVCTICSGRGWRL